MKTIKVNDLKKLFRMVIDQLHILENVNEIEVNIDSYRYISADEWQNFDENKNPLIGSLHDDIDELEKLLNDKDRVISYVDFDRIASILHFISEKMNPVNNRAFKIDKD